MKVLGIDTGGTFTDFVLFDGKCLKIHKVISTPDNPAVAIFKGLNEIKEKRALESLDIVHGSTVATNALLERKGANTALITTKGYEDIIEIGRQNRSRLYDLFIDREPPIISTKKRWGIIERATSKGEVQQKVKTSDLKNIKNKLKSHNIDSIAICFLFSYKNPRNEEIVFNELKETGYHISASHKILPEHREYERFIATVINAYVSPVMAKYLTSLEQGLKKANAKNVRIMQSNGGSISTLKAKEKAINCILSGPAGGVIGALKIAKTAGIKKIISFDMGGTSTDVSLCDGNVRLSTDTLIGELPIKTPIIDIYTVGAGGGSIAEINKGGALSVGPESAGAYPGPVCYGKGEKITVTDANLFLGRLSANHFLGGRMRLHAERVHTFLKPIAKRLKVDALEVANGIVNIANSNMERAIKVVSVERGFDVREFTLVSFGGAGGLHACELARSLSIPQILIPKNAGVLSALGIASADVIKDYSKSLLKKVTSCDYDTLIGLVKPLVTQAKRDIVAEGCKRNSIRIDISLDMRYVGQSFELNLTLSKDFLNKFHQLHKKSFGYANKEYEVEVVNLRVRGTGKAPKPSLKKKLNDRPNLQNAFLGKMKSYFQGEQLELDVYDRIKIPVNAVIKGPALIIEDTATTFIPPGFVCNVDNYENLILEDNGS